MTTHDLQHVSKLVPRNTKLLTGLLIGVAVVNSAVSPICTILRLQLTLLEDLGL